MPTDKSSKRNHGLKGLRGKPLLITGGAGMLGSAIAEMAVDAGARVTILDNLAPAYGGNLFNLSTVADHIRFVKGDVRDQPLLERLVPGQDAIFHLAAPVRGGGKNDPFEDLDVNGKGHLAVLEACRRHNAKARIIFASSRLVYGKIKRLPVDESHPCDGLGVYGAHKLLGETYCRIYHELHGIDAVIFRISNIYGPRQQMKHGGYGILNWFIRQALRGEPLTIYGRGLQKRDYVYVDDLARGMLLGAVAGGLRCEVLNIGSGKGIALKDMAALVARAAEGKVRHAAWPKDYPRVETGDYVSDLSKIRRVLTWRPATPIEEGIEKTVAYYRRFGRHYFSDVDAAGEPVSLPENSARRAAVVGQ